MNAPFENFIRDCQQRMAAALERNLGDFATAAADSDGAGAQLEEAVRYSLLNGGKRVRPLLVFASARAAGAAIDDTLLERIACAVEYIHAYSLVHDDLPAMDNDELRRGKPTCHRVYGEATAILVGDALQCRAFELLAELDVDPALSLRLIRTLAAAAGARGMVAGQAIDLAVIARDIDARQLETMHRLKTGALIRAAVAMGALAGGADERQRADLDRYAEAIGLAFQVQDDVLDITSETDVLGKQQGADQARDKPTYPSLLGLEPAQALVRQLHRDALAALDGFDASAQPLRQLADYISSRVY